MALGKNKGHKYEDRIFELLEAAGLLYKGATKMGMKGGIDAIFCHIGKPYNLEIKNSLHTDYGQQRFSWAKKTGWFFRKNNETTKFFIKDLNVIAVVNKKKIIPIRYTKPKNRITYADGAADQKAFEAHSVTIGPKALWRYYANKGTHYIQVGGGYGFYHLDKDAAKLGTDQFKCDLFLRFRAKYHDRKKRIRNSKGKVISVKNTPWNYSFFVVLKTKGKPKRSKYNLEKVRGQKLPPIKP
jgi:hypothetical protein